MVLRTGKVSSYNLFIGDVKVSCCKEVKLFGISIDNQLKFNKHIEDLWKKASYKIHAHIRLRLYLIVDKARLLANLLIDSQLNYAPLIWMFTGRTVTNNICKTHCRTLQVVYNNFTDTYDALLSINNDISIHQKRLRYLVVEDYEIVVEIIPIITMIVVVFTHH